MRSFGSMTTRETPHVVFGDDLSAGADVAWLWINSQTWSGWELSVVTAEPPIVGTVVPEELSVLHEDDGRPRRPTIAASRFEDVRFLRAAVDPRLALSSCGDASLLVVGAASSGLGPHHIGSTAEWLLQDPAVPTAIARNGRPVRTALICADGSAHAAEAASSLAGMPWLSGLRVEVLAVDDHRNDCKAAVDAVEAIFDGRDVDLVSSTRKSRSPHREIIEVAGAGAIDLIVLGNQGMSGLRRRVLGSTASAVVRHARCSVLVAQAPATD